ncbi:MAG: hypothetical protein ACRC9E_08710 [Plesiomonas shigelloides]
MSARDALHQWLRQGLHEHSAFEHTLRGLHAFVS